ncbi:hypothetical protein SORBI_3009G157400 [Sorghum bicolor]|uniref:Uncharacterized protein n=1 Tax=Sorghum bicolor TaxID=4558 RepID=A0A1B6P8R1_SORBI|nr:hypothetical protein SORBI_3009G157400 [Sorghum bicolor]
MWEKFEQIYRWKYILLSIKHLFPAGRHYSLSVRSICSTPKDIFSCTNLFIRIDLDSLGLLQHTAKPNLTGSSSVNEMATSA